MPAKRDYHIKGTNDFLIIAAIFFFLGIWAIKDAWFPSEKVLNKHPIQIEAAFEVDGVVETVKVAVGSKVVEKSPLAELRMGRATEDYEASVAAHTEVKERHADLARQLRELESTGSGGEAVSDLEAKVSAAAAEEENAIAVVKDLRFRLDSSMLVSPKSGTVVDVLIEPFAMVDAGQPVVLIKPTDHFYLFNKSLMVLSFVLVFVFLGLHMFGR